jgi:hypothetical protein
MLHPDLLLLLSLLLLLLLLLLLFRVCSPGLDVDFTKTGKGRMGSTYSLYSTHPCKPFQGRLPASSESLG